MPGFAAFHQDLEVARDAPASEWNLRMLPLNEMHAVAAPPPAAVLPAPAPAANAAEPARPKPRNAKNTPPPPTNTPTAFQRTDLNAANPPAPAPGTPSQPDATIPSTDAFANQNPSELSQRAADGFLINGTANNAASSPFAMAQAFGNSRKDSRSCITATSVSSSITRPSMPGHFR